MTAYRRSTPTDSGDLVAIPPRTRRECEEMGGVWDAETMSCSMPDPEAATEARARWLERRLLSALPSGPRLEAEIEARIHGARELSAIRRLQERHAPEVYGAASTRGIRSVSINETNRAELRRARVSQITSRLSQALPPMTGSSVFERRPGEAREREVVTRRALLHELRALLFDEREARHHG